MTADGHGDRADVGAGGGDFQEIIMPVCAQIGVAGEADAFGGEKFEMRLLIGGEFAGEAHREDRRAVGGILVDAIARGAGEG